MDRLALAPRDDNVIPILIAADHPMVRISLHLLLEGKPDLVVVGEASDVAQAVKLAAHLRPTIVIAEATLPPAGGVELARAQPPVRTILLGHSADAKTVRQVLADGVSAYLTEHFSVDDLQKAIRNAAGGDDDLDAHLE